MRRIVIALLCVIIIVLQGCKKGDSKGLVTQLETVELESTSQSTSQESIFVYVCGAVVSEGVYELSNGSRVYEAIEAANGFREDAATTAINQAQLLEDEQRVYVPTLSELMEQNNLTGKKINLNTATKEELMTLPGVGESKAESIIQYRQKNQFRKIEDIMEIAGIKEGLFEKIKEHITV